MEPVPLAHGHGSIITERKIRDQQFPLQIPAGVGGARPVGAEPRMALASTPGRAAPRGEFPGHVRLAARPLAGRQPRAAGKPAETEVGEKAGIDVLDALQAPAGGAEEGSDEDIALIEKCRFKHISFGTLITSGFRILS